MTRYARINVPTGIYHVISRMMRGKYLISGARERLRYLDILKRVAGKTDASILGWCLMSNHTHLVIRAGQDPLSRLMKPLNTGFAMWLSKQLGGRGPVFADRFKSILVDEDAYLLALIRYVHNNPVRAGVVLDPSSSEWSSHRAYIGMEPCPPWLNIGYVLGMLSSDSDEARRLFHQFVLEGKDEGRRPDLSGDGLKNMGREVESGFGDGWRISGPIVGDKEFAAKILSDISEIDEAQRRNVTVSKSDMPETPPLPELIGATCIVLNLEPWEFDNQPKRRQPALARRIVAYLWVKHNNMS